MRPLKNFCINQFRLMQGIIILNLKSLHLQEVAFFRFFNDVINECGLWNLFAWNDSELLMEQSSQIWRFNSIRKCCFLTLSLTSSTGVALRNLSIKSNKSQIKTLVMERLKDACTFIFNSYILLVEFHLVTPSSQFVYLKLATRNS